MSREAFVLLVCCCDFRDGAERLIPSKSLRNAVIRAFPGLFRILRMCAPRRAAVVRPRGRKKSADRRRRILISRLLIIRASVPRRKSPFPAYFKGFPAVSPLIPPYPAFLKYPVSPQQYGDDFQSAERVINGSGPWKFVEWQDGQYARYTPNQNYWDPDAVSNIDTLNVWFVNQENAKVSGITSGNLDYTQSLRSDMVPMVENLEGVEVIEYTSDVMYYMQFDCAEDSIFSDPNARKAVAYALDVNTVLGLVGGGEKMNCMFLPSLLGYDESIEGYEYNPDLAREYLAKTDYNGEKLTLYARNDLVAIDDVMAVFIQNLVDVGFNISTKICDSAEFVTIRQDPSAYDIFFVNLGAFDADPYTLYIIPRIVNDTHNSYYHNEELNNLIIDSYTTTDETKREDELKQAARIVYDECGPVLGLYASNSYCVIREGLEGVLVTKGAGPYFRYASVDEAVWNK